MTVLIFAFHETHKEGLPHLYRHAGNVVCKRKASGEDFALVVSVLFLEFIDLVVERLDSQVVFLALFPKGLNDSLLLVDFVGSFCKPLCLLNKLPLEIADPLDLFPVTGLALHTLMQGTATTARYTKRYVQVD